MEQIEIDNLTDEQKAKFKAKVLRWQRDPELWCKEILGNDSYWDKQREILRSVARFKNTTVASGHDVGKSYVAADVALWFLYCFRPSIVITTAPTWRQVEKVLWGEIGAHYHKAKIPLGGRKLETEIKLRDKWYAIGFSSDKPDAFQGWHEENILVIEDEPSGIPNLVDEQIESVLANPNARRLKIGNPTLTIGHFADSINSPAPAAQDGDPVAGNNVIHINCWESPNVLANRIIYPGLVTKAWCEERKKKWGEDSPVYQARVLGNIPTESSDTLIKINWIQASIRRWNIFKGKLEGTIVLSCDVARFGKNKTIIIIRQGRRLLKVESYSKQDTWDTAARIDVLAKEYGPEHIVIDDNGVGGGVSDDLIRYYKYKNVVRVNAGEDASESDKYANKRSELAWRVREAFRTDQLDIPDNEDLVFECNNQYYDLDNKQRIRSMSKRMMKEKGLESPDFFDCLYLGYERELPEGLSEKEGVHTSEFSDRVHLQRANSDDEFYGVSRFQVFVPVLNGSSACIWAMADRAGRIHVYREGVVNRTTSTAVASFLKENEEGDRFLPDERYTPRIQLSDDVQKKRYSLNEQLNDAGYDFEEVEYDPDLAIMNVREGFRFDKSLPLSKDNLPFIFIDPSCVLLTQAVKYMLNPKTMGNDPIFEVFHKALGTLVLAEPTWLKYSEPEFPKVEAAA